MNPHDKWCVQVYFLVEMFTFPWSDPFSDMLCAYRKKYGTEQVSTHQTHRFMECALDEDKVVATVLMDRSKAFDCIPHGLLIEKIKAYGLSIYACEFMASYLNYRYQRAKISNEKALGCPFWKVFHRGQAYLFE